MVFSATALSGPTMRHVFRLTALLAAAAFPATLCSQETVAVEKLPVAQLQQLADTGNAAAENELGLRYRLGSDVEKDPGKAVPWFVKAARQGYAEAYLNLGAMAYNGEGLPVNDMNSCVWFTLAADAGEARSQEAVDRFRQQQSAHRFVECQQLTASAYLQGDHIKQDFGKAMDWYMKAASAGDSVSCEKIAYLYNRGLGVPVDKQKSLEWLKRSVDLGYLPAVFELGRAYDIGDGVSADVAQAKKLYEQAAANGYPDAMVALGSMYESGRGVPQDRKEALAYYMVAAGYGNTDAKHRGDQLFTQLTPDQVAAARHEALKLSRITKRPLVLLSK